MRHVDPMPIGRTNDSKAGVRNHVGPTLCPSSLSARRRARVRVPILLIHRCWRADRDAWLPRMVAAEILCVLLFGQWYLARYYLIGIHSPIMVVISMCIIGVLLILLGGLLWDRRRRSPRED